MTTTYVVILIYFLLIFGVARYFSRKESLQEYFLNNKSSSLRLLVFANVATLVWAWAVVTTVSEVYNSGISMWLSNIISFLFWAILLALLSPQIYKFWLKHWIYNVVDFFAKRFDKKNQILVLILQLFLLIVWTSIQIMAIALLVSSLVWIGYYVSLLISVGITILYTSMWWLKIDIITDFIQFWIIFLVFIIMAVIWYQDVWWFHSLISQLSPGHLNPFAFGWIWFFVWWILFGGLVYIPNSCHRQRILSAKDESTAKKSFYRSIPFLVLLMAIVVFLWLVAAVSLPSIPQDNAIFALMKNLLSNKRLLWIWFSCILAVVMSSVDSLLVAGSTIIYRWFIKQKNVSEKKWMLRARLLTAWFGVLCMILSIVAPSLIFIWLFVMYLALIFVPAILAGMFSSKISSNASFYSLLIPSVILIAGYIPIWKNIFILTTVLAIVIVLFYDKIFRNK